MPYWIRDEADYEFRDPGQTQDCRFRVTALMDGSEAERPKFLLEDRWDNKGASVQEDAFARDAGIKSLSASMKIEPGDADWFTRDQDGQLQAVTIGYQSRTQEDPDYTKLLRSGEFNQLDKDDAKKSFPDVTVSELRTSVYPAQEEQKSELATAFREAIPAQYREPDMKPEATPEVKQEAKQQVTPEVASVAKSAQEYDLSQEQFHER